MNEWLPLTFENLPYNYNAVWTDAYEFRVNGTQITPRDAWLMVSYPKTFNPQNVPIEFRKKQ